MSNTDEAINYPRIKSVKFQTNAEYIYVSVEHIYIYIYTQLQNSY